MVSVHLENGRVEMREAPRPARPPGFALIRLLVGGICNTDLELQRGYYGFRGTPGHEFVGEVVETDNSNLVGCRVAGEINLCCGRCEWCARKMGRHCPSRVVLGIVNHPGCFQELFVLPERNLHVIPDEIATDHGVFVEPLAAACEILEQVHPPCGACFAVIGDGKLGLLIAQVLRAYGYQVSHFGRHAAKLTISASAGAQTHLHPPPPDAFDWVVEATGSSEGLESAIRTIRPRGTLILKSTVHDRASIDWARVIVNEISMIGSRCGRFETAIELLRLGSVEVAPMISERWPLAEAPRAFERAAEKGVLKVLLEG